MCQWVVSFALITWVAHLRVDGTCPLRTESCYLLCHYLKLLDAIDSWWPLVATLLVFLNAESFLKKGKPMVLAFTCTPSKHARFGLLNRTRTTSEQQAENRKPCSPMPTDSANSYISFTEITVLASVSWTEAWWYLLCVRGMSGTQAEMVFISTLFFKKSKNSQLESNTRHNHIDNYFTKDKTHLFLS